ncbi:MAG: ABC transporter ATP-binding protein [Ardenticatenales bacterium]|nr:ABC transporter ATP-binding protein [Ardenticatenales bacterium]
MPRTTLQERDFDVEFRAVTKKFGLVTAVDDVSFSILKGSFHSFLGPSGCGKTSSLRLIGGFEQPDAGEILVNNKSVVGVPPYRRQVNMVFQHYALFPHMDVATNVGYGLRQQRPRLSNKEIQQRVGDALALVRLSGYDRRRTWELSGGQQQRVALARALINKPTVLLLDEPLAALDRKLRKDMQVELKTLQREVGITFVFVTHDQEEALSMSDHIAVMRDGRIVQEGSPTELYHYPLDRYVAGFIGQSNFIAGKVIETGNQVAIRTPEGVVLRAPPSPKAKPLLPGESAVLALRPERIQLSTPEEKLPRVYPGYIAQSTFLGDQTEYHIRTETAEGSGVGALMVRTSSANSHFAPGEPVHLSWEENSGLVLLDD